MNHVFMRLMVAITFVAGIVAISGCGNRDSSRASAVSINGSSTVAPITIAVAEEFLKDNPDVQVSVGTSGTGAGFKKFGSGEIDICDASRVIKETERAICEKAGIEFVTLEVAYDGLAIVAHPEADWFDCLTLEQLKDIWKPESSVKKWSDINPAWPAEEIKLYGPGTDSGTFDYFTEVIVGQEKASRADYTASEDDNVLVRGVTADKYALGYFGYAYYAENRDSLKLIGVDSGKGCVQPSTETVRNGSYEPLSRPLLLYIKTASLKQPPTAAFIQFYLKHAAQLVEEVGYVPVSEEQHQKNVELVEQVIAGTTTEPTPGSTTDD
ncbi:PstS family phosphate ABC transporter substrate-binding protein [Symmachiella dynata]|uniref:Phosphate-binding protein n=1 Tax=Symmachiella dynata TaxID=2527995 RepID=A0A517ZHX8_9PLAN|nr:PstS family phosphate ABC transporter substrate-binding protein [Symmachiella dynata]QDT46578.1 Phosphate-binding protein PstS precursor [Symmachiella dynata]QDU42083.1 Phosphate-binding protein PstS precursor [Symmachiella dynata]